LEPLAFIRLWKSFSNYVVMLDPLRWMEQGLEWRKISAAAALRSSLISSRLDLTNWDTTQSIIFRENRQMKRYLAISILLLYLLKLPWQATFTNLPEKPNTASNPSSITSAISIQSLSSTLVPPTQKPVKTPRITPTHTPRPTATPPEIPPPTDRRLLHSMILFGAIASLTIVFGIWTNRHRIITR